MGVIGEHLGSTIGIVLWPLPCRPVPGLQGEVPSVKTNMTLHINCT